MSVVAALIALLIIGVLLGLWVKALVDLSRSPLPSTEKLVWAIVLVAFPGIGLLAWLIMRPDRRLRSSL